jgi:HTH-type transcriptional regulator, sugar sensing transcriptional regulator
MTQIPGLTPTQSTVYQAALELGPTSVQYIAVKANIPRSTTYLILEELAQLGLISTTKIGNKTRIVAESPQKMLALLESRQQEIKTHHQQLQSLLPTLSALHHQDNKPEVRFYQGFEGIKTVLEQSLAASEILVNCSGYQQPLSPELNNYLFDYYLPETNNRHITTREIITQDPDSDQYISVYNSPHHQIKISPRKPAAHHLDKLIFDHHVALISYDTQNATLITHTQISQFEKSLFYELWIAL